MEYLDYKGVSKVEFFDKTGIKRGFLDTDKLKSTISDVFLTKIIAFLPGLNLHWLITGEGSMEEVSETQNVHEPQAMYMLRTDRILSDPQKIPLFEIESSLGMVSLFQDIDSTKPIDYLHLPNAPKCDGAIFATGDSMYPLIKSGDIMCYKKIEDIQNNVFWGEKYIISLNLSGDEYLTTKFVQKSEKGDQFIKLVSHNKHHQDKDIKISAVKGMALVKVVVRYETPL